MSAVLAAATLGLTRQNLLDQRESSATARTYQNAASAALQLPTPRRRATRPDRRPHRRCSRRSRPRPARTRCSSSATGGTPAPPSSARTCCPATLRTTVASRASRRCMRFDHEGETQLAVGVPLRVDRRRLLRDRVARRAGGDARVDRHLAAGRGAAGHAGRRRRSGWWAARRVLRAAARHRRRRPRHRHRAARHPGRGQRRPRPRRRWPTRSTRWPSPWRSASSATPASPPT